MTGRYIFIFNLGKYPFFPIFVKEKLNSLLYAF